ncbi:hypothetical protein ACFWN1_12545 [Streptomyces sp. NPDC058459]|uniref:hypothetical protein n=1 Tax=Streptomyces sp. NPDC058459 TaxID=3346508 RepID=UPI0036511DE7
MSKTFGVNAPTLAFAARIAELHPQLPAPNLGTNPYMPNELSLCLASVADVEAWREALHVPVDQMHFGAHGNGGLVVEFEAAVEGVVVRAFVLFRSDELAKAIKEADTA